MSFDDPDCSLLNKFDEHDEINAADGKCTAIGDGRAYKSACTNETVAIWVYSDAACSNEIDEEVVQLDACSRYVDPFNGEVYYAMIRNEVISPVAPPEEEPEPKPTEPEKNETDDTDKKNNNTVPDADKNVTKNDTVPDVPAKNDTS